MMPDEGYLTLHRSPNRHHWYLADTQHPVFDPVTTAWIITDPESCERLLGSTDTRPATYSDDYAVLEKRLGIDFSNVLLAFMHIPMCLHEESHRTARRRIAEHLATRKAGLSARMTDSLRVHFKALAQEGEIDLVHQVLEPLVLNISEAITDIPADIAVDCRTVSTIFDKSIGPRKRQRIDTELNRMRAAIVTRLGTHTSEDDIGMRLALAILGRDTLLGTLGESLYSILAANEGRRLNEITYPSIPPETGVPYIERIAVKPICERGTLFKAGDRLRIYLQAFVYSKAPREQGRIFGVGAHLCLGRALALDLWQGITSALGQVPLYAEVVAHDLRKDDYVFLCPSRLDVRLHS